MRRASLVSIIRVIAGVYLISLAVKLIKGVIYPVIDAVDPVKAAEQMESYVKYKWLMLAAGILFAVVGAIVAVAGVISTIKTFQLAAEEEKEAAEEKHKEEEEQKAQKQAELLTAGSSLADKAALMARDFPEEEESEETPEA